MNKRTDIKKITMYSTSWCSDCTRARAFFDEFKLTPIEINIEEDPSQAKIVEKINDGNRSVPTIITEYKDGTTKTMVEPNRDELENAYLTD